ncbi:MAG TPA: hypothetical protein VK912_00720 [Longimicrobiales bacterium]|nr:hypothetical protein [Longimicrobiales bacterium]
MDERRFALAVSMCFAAVIGVGLMNHEMWRDELQAWLIARGSRSLSELIYLVTAEGHPALWHLLLYPLSRVTADPAVMQVLHLILATCVVYIASRHAPFPRWQRVLLACSYFLAFEYAVISRSYVLAPLSLFSICALASTERRTYIPVALLLVVLANTSAYGLLVAGAVSAGLIVDAWTRWRGWQHLRRRLPIQALIIVLLGAALSAGQILAEKSPSSGDRRPRTDRPPPSTQWKAAESLGLVSRAYVPIPRATESLPAWWNRTITDSKTKWSMVAGVILSVALLAVFGMSLLDRPAALTLLVSGTLSIVFVSYAFHRGGMRHYGHLFLVLVAALWLARVLPGAALSGRLGRIAAAFRRPAFIAFALVLGAQSVAAGLYLGADLDRPFSSARETAEFLEDLPLDRVLIASTENLAGSSVSAYLRTPIFYMNTQSFGTYSDWRLRWYPTSQALPVLRRLLSAGEYHNLVIISGRPLPDWLASGNEDGWVFDEIARFDEAIVGSERFLVYRARLLPPE